MGQALHLLQRAQAIREVTLGKDHSSLRVSRERVADLQLQASEDHLAEEDSFTPPPVLERVRIGSGEIRSVPLAPPAPTPLPARERITATHGWTIPEPIASEPRLPLVSAEANVVAPVREEPLPTVESAATDVSQQQTEAVPYRDMILSIQSELEPGEERAGLSERAAALFGSAVGIFRKRDRSVEIGVAVVTLMLIAFAGSRAFGNIEDAAVSEVAVNRGVPPTALAYAPVISPPAPAVEESLNVAAARSLAAAAALNASRPRATEKTAATRGRSSAQSVAAVAAIPKAVSVNLDSVVRSMNAAGRDVGTTILSEPATTMTAGSRPSFRSEETIPAKRATLIGAMPVPRFPIQLGPIGGEVRIRFMVDTLGRPMMATFSVMSSPDPVLTASVKDVVPRMRFEPARTEGPDPKPTSEWVETVFRFER
jgi:TonB family protein